MKIFVISLAIFIIIVVGILLSVHIVAADSRLIIIPKNHLSFNDTFTSVDYLIKRYNDSDFTSRVSGEGVNRYLIEKLKEKKLITLSDNIDPNSSPKYTLEQFNNLFQGMTYKQVKQLFGDGGELQSQSSTGNIYTRTYSWRNGDGSFIMIYFTNGEIMTYTQSGLH